MSLIEPYTKNLDVSIVLSFPQSLLSNVQIYWEKKNQTGQQVLLKSKTMFNISFREKNGVFLPGGLYIQQGVQYNLDHKEAKK